MNEFFLRLTIKPKTKPKKKIMRLSEIKKVRERLGTKKKTVGLITGCFDVLHLGHIELFRFAKKHVDVLVVGIDNDSSVKMTKGESRPIFNQKQRAQQLSELKSVDYVFVIKDTVSFQSDEAEKVQEKILTQLKPTHMFTTPQADKYWTAKKKRAQTFGVKLLAMRKKQTSSTSNIVTLLQKEF